MKEPIIEVRDISKLYNIFRTGRDNTLRDSIMNFFRKKEIQPFWALRNISFDVNEEEIIGIIGRNGSGKSTLLKIISRITPPTSGEIRIKGRVASLLEVGTGFHSELNGRENIYFSGSILGMKKREIDRKYADIVAFSGVEQFLETPVKRYSSGMFVRLAFSVAAHLEPEILLIDEVLAVGDVEFQRKCLAKMKELGETGRTILFVSHNMATVTHLCQKVILIDNGEIKEIGTPDTVVGHYLERFRETSHLKLSKRTDRNFFGDVRLTDIKILDTNARTEVETLISGQNILIELEYEALNKSSTKKLKNINIGLAFHTPQGQYIFELVSQQASNAFESLPAIGRIYCNVPCFPLMPGNYYITATLAVNDVITDQFDNAKTIDVIEGDFYKTGVITGPWERRHGVNIPHSWHKDF